jgi:hypothetical protein
MPVATLPSTAPSAPAQHHSAVRSATDPALDCPSCGSTMALTPNPYFGTGLAEHRTIALCNGCHHIAFIAEPPVEPAVGVASKMRALFSRR